MKTTMVLLLWQMSTKSQHVQNTMPLNIIGFGIHVKRGDVHILKVDTTLQNADYLTKALPKEVFVANLPTRARLVTTGFVLGGH
jgi:hypothetical protein